MFIQTKRGDMTTVRISLPLARVAFAAVALGTLTACGGQRRRGSVQFERPLCRYPKYPRYTGPANDPAAARLASNYICT